MTPEGAEVSAGLCVGAGVVLAVVVIFVVVVVVVVVVVDDGCCVGAGVVGRGADVDGTAVDWAVGSGC